MEISSENKSSKIQFSESFDVCKAVADVGIALSEKKKKTEASTVTLDKIKLRHQIVSLYGAKITPS